MIAGVVLALISAVCWGIGGIVFKIGLRGESELSGNLIRSIFSVLFLLPLVFAFGMQPLNAELAALIVLSTIFSFFIGDILYFNALKNSPVSYALPLASTYPVFVAILDLAVYGYPITLNVLLASLLTISAIIAIPKETGKFTAKSFTAVLAAISWSVSIVTLDYLTDYLSPVTLAFLRLSLNSVLLFGFVRKIPLGRNLLIFMGFAGGLISVAGILSFVTSVSLIGSNLVTPLSATSPVIGSIAGKIFLKEKIGIRHVIALMLVFLSVITISQPPVMITPATDG
ncbi:DMT family transporter [Geoglobus acetivorans]|uniref:EamA domain-containing protein n=1 Tax=Geoglobus acetivorans TaxID=565033 RepID=A0A0A7GJW3_GEOAI|nr:hypothetical protein GACE_2200 [Geoglobus acetivorans]